MAPIAKLGRTLPFIGLLITLTGVGWMLAVVTDSGAATVQWTIIGPVCVIGMGMGTCFGILFDIAPGGVDPDEAGSASGALSAVQQLAAGIGSAAVTSVYFAGLASDGMHHAMILSVVVVIGIVVLCNDHRPPCRRRPRQASSPDPLVSDRTLRRAIRRGRWPSGPRAPRLHPECRSFATT